MHEGRSRLIAGAIVIFLVSLVVWGFFGESQGIHSATGGSTAMAESTDASPTPTSCTPTIMDPCATPPIPTPSNTPPPTPLPHMSPVYLPLAQRGWAPSLDTPTAAIKAGTPQDVRE